MGRDWVHAALEVKSRFLLDLRVGPRTLEMAANLVATVAMVRCCVGRRLAGKLLLLVDNHLPYPSAILQVMGRVRHRRRRYQRRGRRKLPDLALISGVLVGAVEKVRNSRGKLLRVRTHALLGGAKHKIVRLIKHLGIGRQINTAHLERLNGTLRTQQQGRLGRRTRNVSRRTLALQWSLWLWRNLYNWVRPHASLDGATPAMAIGLADHVWNVREYARCVVHVSELQRQIWAEERAFLLTSELEARNRKKSVPLS
jgi:hypothetical protein